MSNPQIFTEKGLDLSKGSLLFCFPINLKPLAFIFIFIRKGDNFLRIVVEKSEFSNRNGTGSY
jgi:hypothetical protein